MRRRSAIRRSPGWTTRWRISAPSLSSSCEREEASAVHLVGFSWGTVAAARYAERYPQTVSRLALYAPLYAEANAMWLDRIGDPADRTRIDPTIGAYRLITQADIRQRWNADIGSPIPNCSASMISPISYSTPWQRSIRWHVRMRRPPFARRPARSPTWSASSTAGRCTIRPGSRMPVLLIRGADDTTSTDTRCEEPARQDRQPAKGVSGHQPRARTSFAWKRTGQSSMNGSTSFSDGTDLMPNKNATAKAKSDRSSAPTNSRPSGSRRTIWCVISC